MKNNHLLTPYFLGEHLPELKIQIGDGWEYHEVDLTVGLKPQERMVQLYRPLRDSISKTIINGLRPISLAGDCCASIAVVAGIQMAGLSPKLIWLDAHGDFNTWETTPSGFLGGMPLAMITGRGEQTIMEGVGAKPLSESQIWLSDARDLDPDEKIALHNSKINHIRQIETFLSTPLPVGPFHLHFDTDVIDPEIAPAMSYPAPGGATAAALKQLFRKLIDSEQVVAVSISAWNPKLDTDNQTAKIILDLIATF